MDFNLPKIYPITDSAISGLSHAEQVKRLIAGGARLIQLREKTASSRDFYRAAAEAMEIAADSHCSILINDRVDIAYAVGVAGVHLGQDDIPASTARKILGPDAVIGLSTHTTEQAMKAVDAPVDYIAFGPIFDTATKGQCAAGHGSETIKKIRRSIGSKPLVVIGGIESGQLTKLFALGADSAAIISGILRAPEQITEQMRLLTEMVTQKS